MKYALILLTALLNTHAIADDKEALVSFLKTKVIGKHLVTKPSKITNLRGVANAESHLQEWEMYFDNFSETDNSVKFTRTNTWKSERYKVDSKGNKSEVTQVRRVWVDEIDLRYLAKLKRWVGVDRVAHYVGSGASWSPNIISKVEVAGDKLSMHWKLALGEEYEFGNNVYLSLENGIVTYELDEEGKLVQKWQQHRALLDPSTLMDTGISDGLTEQSYEATEFSP